jgi:hypothetical protein
MHNFIIEFQDALTPHYCQELIAKFEHSTEHHPGRTGAGVDKSKKDSVDLSLSNLPDWQDDCKHINGVILKACAHYAQMFPMFLTGAISPSLPDPQTGELKAIEHSDIAKLKIEQVAGITSSMFRFDDINMQRYTKGVGGYHHWHSEHYPLPTDSQQRPLHRVLLYLVYLNDVAEGGETEFLYQQAKIKPKQGSLVLAPCGFTHSHRGSIPVSNDKYVLASWVMYKDAASLYAQAPQT